MANENNINGSVLIFGVFFVVGLCLTEAYPTVMPYSLPLWLFVLSYGMWKSKSSIVSSMLGCFCGIVIMMVALLPQGGLDGYVDTQISMQGQVQSVSSSGFQMIVKIDTIEERKTNIKYRILIHKPYGYAEEFSVGQRVQVSGQLEAPAVQRNPGGFDEGQYLKSQGVFYKFKSSEINGIEQDIAVIYQWSNDIRNSMDHVLQKYLSEPQYQLVLALLLGEKSELDDTFYQLSQKFGIAHVFAVSGLHVGFVAAFVIAIMRLIKKQNSILTIVVLSGVLIMYCLMVGLTPSAVRASIMAILALIGAKCLRYRDGYTILSVAMLSLLLANPFFLWSVGFQLSFVTTGALLYCYPRAKQMCQPIGIAWLVDGLAVSIAAQIGSLPIVAYHFYMVSGFSVLLNIIIVPIIGVVVPLLLVSLCSALLIPPLAMILFWCCDGILFVVRQLIEGIAWLIGTGHLYIGQPSLVAIGMYFILIWCWREKRWFALPYQTMAWASYVIAVCCCLFLWLPQPKNNEVVFLDVGQGSAAVVYDSKGRVLLFDGGVAKSTVATYLKYSGVNKVDSIVLSHGDADHITGLYQVVEDFSVDYLFVPPDLPETEQGQQLVNQAMKKNIDIIWVDRSAQLKLGEQDHLWLELYTETGRSTNGQQLISVVEVKGKQIGFPGDSSIDFVEDMIKKYPNIVVWAVPHHGSKYSCSQEIYQQFRPQIAVISAGAHNRYGHPNPFVLEQLEQQRIPYQRTDLQGAVTIKIQQEQLSAWGFKK